MYVIYPFSCFSMFYFIDRYDVMKISVLNKRNLRKGAELISEHYKIKKDLHHLGFGD